MKRNTIKWRIFKYNLIVIAALIVLTAVIFNVAVKVYIESEIIGQLNKIASQTENTALQHGPDFFSDTRIQPPLKPHAEKANSDPLGYYFMLDRSLKEPLSVLNADYILIDNDKNRIYPTQDDASSTSGALYNEIKNYMSKSQNLNNQKYFYLYVNNIKYAAIIKPVYQKNSFGLGWIIIYSSLQKINQLQWVINAILFTILILSALIIVFFSSLAAKKISAPFSSLNKHIENIAERNFGRKIQMQVDDELQEFVNNINIMSEKLEMHDKAQKTFLQNVSHEFRTPLMSIQSYAEGIVYDVVDSKSAANIIIDESKRMTRLVEDLLYLSRLDAIEENYHFNVLDFNDLINSCVERLDSIATKNNVRIEAENLSQSVQLNADEEKLSRAVMNIISNCIRYAKSIIELNCKIVGNKEVELTISDDGPGFDPNEIQYIFDRFYKGKKGNFGLGLSISKNVIEKHNGTITAENSKNGAVFRIVLPIAEIQ